MLKNKIVVFCSIIGIAILSACGPNVIYDNTVQVPEQGWHKDTVAVFKSEVENLKEPLHLLLKVKNTDEYKYNNIWFFVDAVSPTGNVHRDTLDLPLASDAGDWYGKSSFGKDDFSSIHPYKLNIQFPEKGLYKYYVFQGMRDTILTGITEIGIQIIEVN